MRPTASLMPGLKLLRLAEIMCAQSPSVAPAARRCPGSGSVCSLVDGEGDVAAPSRRGTEPISPRPWTASARSSFAASNWA